MHRLFRLHHCRMSGIHVVGIRRDQLASAVRGVAILHAEILHAQPSNRRHHPAILVAMIVDAAHVPDFPADSHHFKKLTFINQVSRGMALGVKKITSQCLRANSPRLRELQHARNCEFFCGDGAQLFHPLVNRHVFHARRSFHRCPPAREARTIPNTALYLAVPHPAAENACAASVLSWTSKMSSHASHNAMNLLGKSAEELRAFLQSLGESAYRGAQIYHALYVERRFDLRAITNLPAALRERLVREAAIALPQILRRHRSSDGTVRYVLSLAASEPRHETASR